MSSDKDTYMYPPIEPDKDRTGFLPVGNGHEIYWEECGNPNGFPIFFIHGGPGAGCDADDRRFFNPDKWRIILHDQRGCNRSKARNKLEANTTWDLVGDICTLRRKLNIEKYVLFGGSWGSTLALVYSIIYPRGIVGMILRGIFLGEQDEVDYLYNGSVALYRPDAWKRFASRVPPEYRNNVFDYYKTQLASDDPAIRRKFAYEWSFFEMCLLHLKPQITTETTGETNGFDFESMALMETHYFENKCYMEDGYIINNASNFPDIPISIIQGEYDLVCPPISAYRLHEALPQSVLHMTLAGHSSTDIENLKKLISETEAMFDKVSG